MIVGVLLGGSSEEFVKMDRVDSGEWFGGESVGLLWFLF